MASCQTFHDADASITNPNPVSDGHIGIWDFALQDNGALAGETYCIALKSASGLSFNEYDAITEITMAGGGNDGPTLEQQLRGGQAVVNGIKSPFSW